MQEICRTSDHNLSSGGRRRGFPADRAGRRVLDLVAAARGVDPAALLRTSRGKAPVALSRQIAMYLMHVVLSRTLIETGRFFGRDRTTVAHACALVEDKREDQRFDAELDALQTLIEETR